MEFKLPDIGEGVHEGELVRWLVKEGDLVKVDQPVVEVMTDKATVEIPVSYSGKVEKLNAKEGEIVKVGQTLMTLNADGAGVSKAPPAKTENTTSAAKTQQPAQQASRPQSSAPQPQAPQMQASAQHAARPQQQQHQSQQSYTASPGNVLATPATRRLARDLGVDLTSIPASGPQGRVTKDDVQNFVGATAAGPQMPVQSRASQFGSAQAGASQQARMPSPQQAPKPSPLIQGQRETLIPFRGIRKKISEAMSKSRFTIPDFTYVDECDISELVEFRKEAKLTAEKEGVKLTYMPFIVKAVIRGLKEFPYMNAEFDETGGNIVLKNYYNIGIAVDTEQGLIVPVVKDADRKSILEIARDIQTLSEKARMGKLALDDMKGGTFTITNAGTIGGLLATPVINFPEVAIFGVHKIDRKPIVKKVSGKEEIVIADMIWLSAAVDHRIVDGAVAARFMNVVMSYLSNPKKMLLDMA